MSLDSVRLSVSTLLNQSRFGPSVNRPGWLQFGVIQVGFVFVYNLSQLVCLRLGRNYCKVADEESLLSLVEIATDRRYEQADQVLF